MGFEFLLKLCNSSTGPSHSKRLSRQGGPVPATCFGTGSRTREQGCSLPKAQPQLGPHATSFQSFRQWPVPRPVTRPHRGRGLPHADPAGPARRGASWERHAERSPGSKRSHDAPLPVGDGVQRHERLVDDAHQGQPRLQVVDADEDSDAGQAAGEDAVAGLHVGTALDVLVRGICKGFRPRLWRK